MRDKFIDGFLFFCGGWRFFSKDQIDVLFRFFDIVSEKGLGMSIEYGSGWRKRGKVLRFGESSGVHWGSNDVIFEMKVLIDRYEKFGMFPVCVSFMRDGGSILMMWWDG